MPGPNDPATTRALARVGSVLRGKWRLDKLLGVGGMAAVYAATHRNGQRGAVKLLHADLAGDEDSQRRFLREGYAANAVGHGGAVSVLDDDVAEDGSVFLVMELLSGRTVDDLAESRAGARLAPGEVLAIADQLLDVLAAAHEKGIVHRDLKPENLFITEAGQIKVLDFGLARFADATHARLTSTGAAPMGTPAFMPPEQARGEWESVDAQSDVWAVGATMFTLLTGRIVHDENNFQRLMASAMLKPAPLVATIDPSVPAPLAAIVDRALAFEKRDRWPDARAMRDAVRQARTTIRAELGPPGDPAFFDERTTGLRLSPPQIAVATPAAVPVRSQVRTSTLGATATTPKVASNRRGALIGGGFVVVALAGAALALHFVRGHAEGATNATTPSSPPHSQGAPSTTAAPLAATADAEAKSGGTPVPSATTTVAASASPESSVRPVVLSPRPAVSVGRGDPKTPPSSGGAPPLKPTGSPSSDPMGKW